MKPTRTALAALLALTALAAHADATLDRIKQRGKIVVGVMLSGPPFGTIDPVTQRHVGYNVQLSEGVAKGLGVGVETVQVQPSNRVQFLQQGKVDILIANMQWTQERSEILSFVPTPFEEVGGAAIAKKGSGVRQWDDLRGKPVCVSQGSTSRCWPSRAATARPPCMSAPRCANSWPAMRTGRTTRSSRPPTSFPRPR